MSRRIKFVDASLAKLPGARATARFDVHVIYEQKIDVAAERERLKKEVEKAEKGKANNQRQVSERKVPGQGAGESGRRPEKTGAGVRVLIAKLKSQLDELN